MNEEKIKKHREELENEWRYLRGFRYMRTKRSWADKRILEWCTGKIWRMIAESWEWINLKWWTPDNQTEKTLELLRMGEKNCHNWKQLWEDGNKLESRIIERMDKIERKFFFGLQNLRMTTRNAIMTYLGTPEESKAKRLSPRWK